MKILKRPGGRRPPPRPVQSADPAGSRSRRINDGGSPPKPSSADGAPMAPLTHDQDITSWMQLLSAIEEAEAGHGTARLTEICLSVYGALADARFQITQLRARVHLLAIRGPLSHGSPVTATGPRLHPDLPTHRPTTSRRDV